MKRNVIGVMSALCAAVLVAGCGGGAVENAPAAAPSASSSEGHAGHTTVAAPPAEPLRAGERFMELSMERPYTPEPPTAGGTDDYRCFLVDPGFTKRTFFTGSQFLPQNASIVHHAIFFRVPPADVAEAKRLDAQAPGDGWTCFGGTGIGGDSPARQLASNSWIASWAPGGKEYIAEPGYGTMLEPGTQVVMQVHYNLLATGGKASGTDKSSLRVRLAPGDAALEPLNTSLLVAPIELPCTAEESGPLCDRERSVLDSMRRFGQGTGQTIAGLNLLCNAGQAPKPGNTQSCSRPARDDIIVRAAAGHMHLLGRSIKIEVNPGTPKAAVLLDNQAYNFDDQGARQLPKPVKVAKGDILKVTCSHDASLRRKLPELKTLQPRYVVWGEGTSDEMCLGVMVYSKK